MAGPLRRRRGRVLRLVRGLLGLSGPVLVGRISGGSASGPPGSGLLRAAPASARPPGPAEPDRFEPTPGPLGEPAPTRPLRARLITLSFLTAHRSPGGPSRAGPTVGLPARTRALRSRPGPRGPALGEDPTEPARPTSRRPDPASARPSGPGPTSGRPGPTGRARTGPDPARRARTRPARTTGPGSPGPLPPAGHNPAEQTRPARRARAGLPGRSGGGLRPASARHRRTCAGLAAGRGRAAFAAAEHPGERTATRTTRSSSARSSRTGSGSSGGTTASADTATASARRTAHSGGSSGAGCAGDGAATERAPASRACLGRQAASGAVGGVALLAAAGGGNEPDQRRNDQGGDDQSREPPGHARLHEADEQQHAHDGERDRPAAHRRGLRLRLAARRLRPRRRRRDGGRDVLRVDRCDRGRLGIDRLRRGGCKAGLGWCGGFRVRHVGS